jgi:hypothetical protein
VRFFVDGRLSWIDRSAPYVYGGNGGYLVTTWLAEVIDPGFHTPRFTRHRFTTEAIATDGSRATERVVLRVRSMKLQRLPYGIWVRAAGNPARDRAIDFLSEAVLWVGDPIEDATAYEVRADGGTLHILAPIRKAPAGTGVTEFGWHFDSYDCGPRGPFAVYAWSFTRGSLLLELTAKRDPCRARRAKLEGTWQRDD